MSRNTRFIWCLLASLLFCAVTYGGCGGSDNLASVADTSGGGTSQPVSGDTSGRGDWDDWEVIPDPDKGWEVLDDLGYLEGLVNTWKITNIYMEAGNKLYGQESMVSSGMIGSTFKMNVSNPKVVWGSGSMMEENEGTVNVGNYGLWCMFRLDGDIVDVELIPNNAVFQSVHNGMNLSYKAQLGVGLTSCTIDVEDYAATRDASKLTIYYSQYNRQEWPYELTIATELEAVY